MCTVLRWLVWSENAPAVNGTSALPASGMPPPPTESRYPPGGYFNEHPSIVSVRSSCALSPGNAPRTPARRRDVLYMVNWRRRRTLRHPESRAAGQIHGTRTFLNFRAQLSEKQGQLARRGNRGGGRHDRCRGALRSRRLGATPSSSHGPHNRIDPILPTRSTLLGKGTNRGKTAVCRGG